MAESDKDTQLQERLAKARAEMAASLAVQKELSKTNSLLTWAIIIYVLVVIVMGWSKFRSNFSSENIQESLVTNGPAIMTQVADAVTEAASEVVPVYVDEAQKKYVEVMPDLAMALDKEMDSFSTDATQKVNQQLQDALKRVSEKQQAAIRQQFPDLDEAAQKRIVENLAKEFDSQLEGLTGQIMAVTIGDLEQLNKAIKGFDTTGLPNSESEISRQIMHHFLLVLDAEMMEVKLEDPKGGK